MTPDTRITVVMITRNRAQEAVHAVGRLLALPERPAVIVVDNGSSDGTPEALRDRHPAVDIVEAGRNLGCAGRNLGVRRARTPFVAFADDDSSWAPGALSLAADLLDRHSDLALVCARILVGPEEREDPVSTVMAASPLPNPPGRPGRPLLGFVAMASMVRRSAFLAAGGFEGRFLVGGEEDLLAVDLAAAGWGLAYAPEVAVYHHPSPQRDPAGRRRVLARNALWVAWMRLPADLALRRTARVLRSAAIDPAVRQGVGEAVRALPWALRSRRRLAPPVRDGLRLLEPHAAWTRRPRRGRQPDVIPGDTPETQGRPAPFRFPCS